MALGLYADEAYLFTFERAFRVGLTGSLVLPHPHCTTCTSGLQCSSAGDCAAFLLTPTFGFTCALRLCTNKISFHLADTSSRFGHSQVREYFQRPFLLYNSPKFQHSCQRFRVGRRLERRRGRSTRRKTKRQRKQKETEKGVGSWN